MSKATHNADQAAVFIKTQYTDFKPRIGIVLGSGLGGFGEHLEDCKVIPYQKLPGFPSGAVHGHAGNMVLGSYAGVEVVALQGRAHYYEGNHSETVKTYVRTLQRLGCEYFIATNASGSLNPDAKPGQLMLITDHINLQGCNPLIGPNDDDFGPRFFPVDALYNLELRKQFLNIAQKLNIPLHQGVYIAVLGPNYETAAEIKAFRILGADVVGMSTVPEVLVAQHCGMKVGVISTITNYATGLNVVAHDHNEVVKVAAEGGKHLNQLLCQWIEEFALRT
ncbi:MAG: purine-nucleoside phosphorylase [Gammaproteobacteria bacterium]